MKMPADTRSARGMKSIAPTICCFLSVTNVIFAGESYFPIKASSHGDGLDARMAESYGQSLILMDEPRLPSLAKDKDLVTYRFTILPAWGNAISVRIRQEGRVLRLWAKRLDGKAGLNHGKLAEHV